MHKKSNNVKQALNEFEKASNSVAVWIITKNDTIRGRITVRWTKSKFYKIAHIAFLMYSCEEQKSPVAGIAHLSGFGYNKISTGLAEIFTEIKDDLKKYHGIIFTCKDWDIMNEWKTCFENSGFKVFEAL